MCKYFHIRIGNNFFFVHVIYTQVWCKNKNTMDIALDGNAMWKVSYQFLYKFPVLLLVQSSNSVNHTDKTCFHSFYVCYTAITLYLIFIYYSLLLAFFIDFEFFIFHVFMERMIFLFLSQKKYSHIFWKDIYYFCAGPRVSPTKVA